MPELLLPLQRLPGSRTCGCGWTPTSSAPFPDTPRGCRPCLGLLPALLQRLRPATKPASETSAREKRCHQALRLRPPCERSMKLRRMLGRGGAYRRVGVASPGPSLPWDSCGPCPRAPRASSSFCWPFSCCIYQFFPLAQMCLSCTCQDPGSATEAKSTLLPKEDTRSPHQACQNAKGIRFRSRKLRAQGGWPRPPLNYCILISLALSSSEDSSLTVQEIYKFTRYSSCS